MVGRRLQVDRYDKEQTDGVYKRKQRTQGQSMPHLNMETLQHHSRGYDKAPGNLVAAKHDHVQGLVGMGSRMVRTRAMMKTFTRMKTTQPLQDFSIIIPGPKVYNHVTRVDQLEIDNFTTRDSSPAG
jgi:hypothetical protein